MTKLGAIGATVIACAPVAMTRVTAADPITKATAAVIQTWANAVAAHVAGLPDNAVATVCHMSYRDRVDMNAGVDLFLVALLGGEVHPKENRAAQVVIAAAHVARQPFPATFLKRAAILHTDAAIFRAVYPGSSDTPAPAVGSSDTIRAPSLLSNKPFVTDVDGEIVGSGVADWNWPFARELLDRLISRREPARDPFVETWYHAIGAYMLANGLYSDVEDHLNHAAEILPNDAREVFDRASFAEIMGLPKFQVVRAAIQIPPAKITNAEAERLFRRALVLDPTLVEARVRLGRLLDLRGAHAEALVELRSALAANPPKTVAFYAHLFAARASLNAGNVRDASSHYRDALSLYHNAQSALLGVSQTALLEADVAAALAPLQRLGSHSTPPDADPWRQYHLASGRDAIELMQALRQLTPPVTRQ